MFINLGLAVVVVGCSHKHELPTFLARVMDSEQGFLHTFQYLHDRLQALTTFGTGIVGSLPAIDKGTSASSSEGTSDSLPSNLDGITEEAERRSIGQITDEPRKAIVRTTTSFQLAHPPPAPKHKQRFKVRPRVLLQLRQISETRSPIPALEVLPSSVFASRLPRRCSRPLSGLNGRADLGVDDFVIVNSQNYDSFDALDNGPGDLLDDENWDGREVVATICQLGKGDNDNVGQAEIYFASGVTWLASTRPSGGYEFVSTDEHGNKTTARWVPKPVRHRRKTSVGAQFPTTPSLAGDLADKKFKFSVLSPHVRRHPVIGSMDRHSIDVLDQYTIPSTPSTTPPLGSPLFSSPNLNPTTPQTSYFPSNPLTTSRPLTPTNPLVSTSNGLRALVQITGIWVAFMEGWSDRFRYSHDDSPSTSSVSTTSPWKRRGTTAGRTETPQSFGSGTRSKFKLSHRSTVSVTPNPVLSPAGTTIPQRANSVGTAFLRGASQRAASPHLTPPGSSRGSAGGQENLGIDLHGGELRQVRSFSSLNPQYVAKNSLLQSPLPLPMSGGGSMGLRLDGPLAREGEGRDSEDSGAPSRTQRTSVVRSVDGKGGKGRKRGRIARILRFCGRGGEER